MMPTAKKLTSKDRAQVLVVEDDATLREALCDTLEFAGFSVLACDNGKCALNVLRSERVGLVVSDVQMAAMDGHTLLRQVKSRWPELPVVLMTAYGSIERAVEAMRDGAADYLVKPFEAEVLVEMVSRFIVDSSAPAGDVVAEDPRTQQLIELAGRVAGSDATVMISGESGSGKEVFARLIHNRSPRAEKPFVAINCAAIPESMLESVLFGYEKGAFTGAYQSRPGKFEQAQGGTLLLDEISEMDLALQAKLLRVLQEREVERLGSDKQVTLDVRVLATTNRNLREEVSAGRFREDLFYRLNVFPLQLPPLRDRPFDIVPIAKSFVERYAPAGSGMQFADDTEQALSQYPWPGNVRELENVIQRALILAVGNVITPADLHFEGAEPVPTPVAPAPITPQPANTDLGGELGNEMKNREQTLILEALQAENGCRKDAAARLGISPRTLRYKLAKLREQGIAIPGMAA
ncbi:sigma-54 dependent transcriptional regulator [Porticoccus sp. W117]|uniref:sigma-54-dependent transcriptional regulator n=1 Tax=Porticoccus sp. W117 TaxID=3054777 RepID=UPI0025931057|nr:sigma-54 dependent transcriptional regulator [Porticoccus sp. W117]MDM3871007.1 sigma-54 dependent transcriptional regulator [Porticoccus sp. W117]